MHCIKCDVEINEKNGTQYFNYVNNIKNIRKSDEINEDFILCDKCYDKKNNIDCPQTPPKPHKAIVSEIITTTTPTRKSKTCRATISQEKMLRY